SLCPLHHPPPPHSAKSVLRETDFQDNPNTKETNHNNEGLRSSVMFSNQPHDWEEDDAAEIAHRNEIKSPVTAYDLKIVEDHLPEVPSVSL
ncbi:hypothetical protein BaRGS_00024864, partial [Batillaria attramentaria]